MQIGHPPWSISARICPSSQQFHAYLEMEKQAWEKGMVVCCYCCSICKMHIFGFCFGVYDLIASKVFCKRWPI
ncbi:hypothetical protein BC940DRAFT_291100 [Gongronella butleri]|nr:hypothetical protein BC940DRAFT_291100 [Gongronella butleri]